MIIKEFWRDYKFTNKKYKYTEDKVIFDHKYRTVREPQDPYNVWVKDHLIIRPKIDVGWNLLDYVWNPQTNLLYIMDKMLKRWYDCHINSQTSRSVVDTLHAHCLIHKEYTCKPD